jgi:hypothetical protein
MKFLQITTFAKVGMAGLNLDISNAGYLPVPSAVHVWPDGRQATWAGDGFDAYLRRP